MVGEGRDKTALSFIPGVPVTDVPEVFDLIERKANVQDLCMQLVKDFYSGEGGREERVFLAVQELKSRGLDGLAAMQYLAQSGDAVGELVQRLLDVEDDESLEKELGIERMPEIIEAVPDFEVVERFQKYYEEAKKRNLLKKHNQTFGEFFQELCVYCKLENPHLSGDIRDEVLTLSNTFGVNEPGYLELLGPKEILRVKKMINPRMLLLGSLGEYSAREYAAVVRKINGGSQANVIDLVDHGVSRYQGENGLNFQIGSAFHTDFGDESMDCVFTNYLIHSLKEAPWLEAKPDKSKIEELLKEIKRILKKGGSFLLVEYGYTGTRISEEDVNKVMTELRSCALQLGFKVEKVLEDLPQACFRPEIVNPEVVDSGAKISSNGFPHYTGIVLELKSRTEIGIRLVKE